MRSIGTLHRRNDQALADYDKHEEQRIANAQEWLHRAYVEEARLMKTGLTLQERIELVHRIDALRDKAFEELHLIPMHVGKVNACREKRAA